MAHWRKRDGAMTLEVTAIWVPAMVEIQAVMVVT